MLPAELKPVGLVLDRLKEEVVTLPENTAVQVAYHLGYLDALQRVAAALDVPEPDHRPAA